ncbi:Protein LCHN [Beauveria bassiana]|uniref:Protein LCHN n=1 Tax=Beauveria bassiana TaxID=176275 RepID=A0A2N6NQ90_BEABA|nr:Protein LCHN [Beauveria bassiana]
MASARRSAQPSASTSTVALSPAALPPLSALFLINFDVKAGYTIVWKRADPAVELEGLVEYKSLPSGLHTVSDDLIYFVHDTQHAGLSAFVNEPTEEEELRNARMIAVGILVPLSYGRLGRAWRHAQNLKGMAAKLAKDASQTKLLERYWEQHQAPNDSAPKSPVPSLPTSPIQDRRGHKRNRSASDGAALSSGPAEHKLSTYHPAWSLATMLDTFGPLVFPIYRAALLRKRILISCHAPVHKMCDFDHKAAKRQRLNPDVDDESGSGWIACTTDSILAVKDTLWDMLITMPTEHVTNGTAKAWPVVECPRGTPVKATQRDLRRFHALRSGLAQLVAIDDQDTHRPDSHASDRSAVRLSSSHSARLVREDSDEFVDEIVEPQSWSALAYNGFMWWASAGEQIRSEEQEEAARDAALLADLGTGPSMHAPQSPSRTDAALTDSIASLARHDAAGDRDATVELAIIAYFHRLTTQIVSVLADVVESTDEAYPSDDPARYTDDDDDDDNEDDLLLPGSDSIRDVTGAADTPQDALDRIEVDSHAMQSMGLDVWSASDAAFVKDLAQRYFSREAVIEAKGVEVCGVRVC